MHPKKGSPDHFTGNERVDKRLYVQSSKKTLVAFFSHSGNTRVIAEQIKDITGGEIFEIKPVKDYPSAYQAVVDQAKKEITANYKPQLQIEVENFDTYDVFFVGSPNWWSTIAPPVATFLSAYDFKGKTIIPFITHEGSRMGHSVADMKKICPTATIVDEHSFRGSNVRSAQDEVFEWLRKSKIMN